MHFSRPSYLLACVLLACSINTHAQQIKTVFAIAMENHNWTQPANQFSGFPKSSSPNTRQNDHGIPYASTVNLTHSSDLKTMEEVFHLTPLLGNAAKCKGPLRSLPAGRNSGRPR